MTGMWPIFLGAAIKPQDVKPTWIMERITSQITNEGDPITVQLRGINMVPNMRCVIWFTDPLAPSGNWENDWFNVISAECAAKGGITCQRLPLDAKQPAGPPTGKGYLDVLFTLTSAYIPGTLYNFTNATRRNRADNQDLVLPDKTMGRDVQILLRTIPSQQGGVAADGLVSQKGGSYNYVRDTSRTPAGLPSIQVQSLGAGGGPLVYTIKKGDGFRIQIVGYNVVPGTVLKIYAANDAQSSNDGTTPSLRQIIPTAAATAGCVGTVKAWTPATSGQWFNGGTITFPDGYVSGTPIIMDFIATQDFNPGPPKNIYYLSSILLEGDVIAYGGVANFAGNWAANTVYKQNDWVYYTPTGRKFFYKAKLSTKGMSPPTDSGQTYDTDYWQEYFPTALSGNSNSHTIIDLPPRYWELRATTDGANITYTIQGPDHSDSTVALTSAGAPPGFDAALQQAIATSGFMTLTNGRLATTNTIQAQGAVTFTVPFAGSGKHSLRLTDLQGTTNSYIIIGDACVFLTPMVPDTVANLYGWNASGGEFGDLYTPNYTTDKPAATWGNAPPGSFMMYNGGRYYYPSKPEEADPANQHQQMDYFYRNGARYMRLPFKIQRLQRVPFGDLYYGDPLPFAKFASQDMRRVIEVARYWLSLPGTRVMFDGHVFGERYVNLQVVDGVMSVDTSRYQFDNPLAEATPASLVDFWTKFVPTMIAEIGPVGWDIDPVNEPKDVGSTVAPAYWAATMQWITNAIRARTGFTGIIHREGTEYTSAQNWNKNGNADANLLSYDPGRNMVFHIHGYNDKDASGTSGTCVAGAGKSRITDITNWAKANGFTRANGYGLFLGETAAGSPTVQGQESCGPLITGELQYLLDNADVWLGFCWWASGFGASYPFSLDPSNGNYLSPVDTPNLSMVSGYWKTGNKIAG